MSMLISRDNVLVDTDYDDFDHEEMQIQWSDLIFLPFHANFKVIVLVAVIHKCILGPIRSVYPIVHCWQTMETDIYLFIIKYFYVYFSDFIYMIDTVLHIMHRQVTDKAMRREYLPKSGLLITLDIISLIPFFGLVDYNVCDDPEFWPNILAFTEFIVIYRVIEYFSLRSNHSFWNLIIGFSIFLACSVNCLTCFWVLLTKHGLCVNCTMHIMYDWRRYFYYKMNQTSEDYATYVFSMVYVHSFVFNKLLDYVVPSTIAEFIICCIFVVLGYLLLTCFVLPKLFAEHVLRLRKIFTAYPIIQRLVEETKRRNPSSKGHKKIENFYSTMWNKRSGVTHIPDIVQELPRYLRVEIRQDLVWPLFHHSPTLRRGSMPFKRWLCETATLNFKLPGEKFFAGPHTHTNLYYLKSGIVQILSGDEGLTPIVSVTSGSIFGDINFLVPPLKRKIMMKCLTCCEVIYVKRKDYIKALYKYPEDRRRVLQLVNERMQHAKALYSCKQHVKDLDRVEHEGIAWVKRKWWEVSDALSKCKITIRKDHAQCNLPLEDTIYHCPKYIGQLVFCSNTQLHTKSMFANVQFPWILTPHSSFITVWHKIVWITVFFVLLLYPPNLTKNIIPTWFRFFKAWTDFVYIFDICISLLTLMTETDKATFASVMFARCKTFNFNLDLLATVWIEFIVVAIGKPQYYEICQFNRIIKIYTLYTGYIYWDLMRNPMITVHFRLIMIYFCFAYLGSYMVLGLTEFVPDISKRHNFGTLYCGQQPIYERIQKCNKEDGNSLYVSISWMMAHFYSDGHPLTMIDSYFMLFFSAIVYYLMIYCRSLLVAAIYLKFREITNFQNFVSNLKIYYHYYKIHSDLLKRLDKYLICHWKYYRGADIMQPHIFQNEPYDIYWKVHGEIAEKIIGESRPFLGADPALIRDLAFAAKFLILPKHATLFLFGVQCQNVTWIMQGHVKCEYFDEDGEMHKIFYKTGCMLSVCSVFFDKAAFRTYVTCTECETLYIKRADFLKIIHRYPNEWSNLQRCISEFSPVLQDIFYKYVNKHRDYQNKLRDRIFQPKRSDIVQPRSISGAIDFRPILVPIQDDVWNDPDSEFMRIWLPFRMIVAIVSMLNASIQGGSGAVWRGKLIFIGAFCDCITWMDISLKLFLAYYDERGLLILSKRKCILHYLLRGFLLDMIGALPWFDILGILIFKPMDENSSSSFNLFCKYANLYIVIGYLDYLSDAPSINSAYLKILKWQLITLLLMFAASHIFMTYCFLFVFDDNFDLVRITHVPNTCWLPESFKVEDPPSLRNLHYSYAESLNLAQNALMGLDVRHYKLDRGGLGVPLIFCILTVALWYALGYSLTMLVLNSRSDTMFQHGVSLLRKFLTAERVDKDIIERGTSHFTYWRMRTKGINIHHLTNERIGVVFRQDLTYYFFKKTFLALDTILKSGESQGRELASASVQFYILPGQDIVREMDLHALIFVVHRGKVVISKNGQKLAVLGKGSIFGQLDGTECRPVRISATSESYADLLQIGIKQFQEIISDRTREHMARHPTFKLDYMATKKHFIENPYDSLPYILRGSNAIKLPWMKAPVKARSNSWYSRWLYIAWLGEPFTTAVIWLALKLFVEDKSGYQIYWLSVPLDCIALTNFAFDFFCVQVVVVDKKCVNRVMGYRRLQGLGIYFDFLALMLPAVAAFTNHKMLHLFRLLRLRNFYKYHFQFCRNFKSKMAPVLLNVSIILLFFHTIICAWIYISCKNDKGPSKLPSDVTRIVNTKHVDYSQWVAASDRPEGCARVVWVLENRQVISKRFVPKNWRHDYILATSHILFYYIRLPIEVSMFDTIGQIYFKLLITFLLYLMYIWIMSVIISFVYTRFRELYQYDFNVDNLVKYLKHSGLSPALLETVRQYTQHLWRRQKGNWMPELVQQAPQCLREDLMGALYSYHLETTPMFRDLPLYFKRQLVARFKRTVIFPGKCIVQEGDCTPMIFFIHEGEVEKWYVDKSGERRMMSLLSTNGFFGQIPGLFPNVLYQYTYITRTVADLITLNYWDWQDLLNGYPDIKRYLYNSARILRKDYIFIA